MLVKSLAGILKIKLEVPNYNIVDWFEVHFYSETMILIKSGLRHADGETKSPYYYEETTFGKNAKRDALKKFNEFISKF